MNGLPPTLMVVNIITGAVEVEHEFPYIQPANPNDIHPQFRRARITAQETCLVSFLNMDRVMEYDKDFKEIWRYNIMSPWAAIRLKNGNMLITDEMEFLTRGVNTRGETVWVFNCKTDLRQNASLLPHRNPVPGWPTATPFSLHGGKNGQGPQLIEVTQNKKVVWILQDHWFPVKV